MARSDPRLWRRFTPVPGAFAGMQQRLLGPVAHVGWPGDHGFRAALAGTLK
jgi:hypothetical protein